MGQYIVKLKDGDRDHLLLWSTVVDAPVDYFPTVEAMAAHFEAEGGRAGLEEFRGRMARVEAKGTSSRVHDSAEDVIRHNRAGVGGTRLDLGQILAMYCREPAVELVGTDPWAD